MGPFTSRSVNQVKEIFHQAKLGFVSPSATATFVTDSGYPDVNRVVGRNDAEGNTAARFAREQGFSRLFTIYQSGRYPEFNAYHFREEANRLGLEVVSNMKTDDKKDFGKRIERIQATNADLVYFSTLDVQQASSFFREARAAGYAGAFLGNEGIASPALLKFAGPLLLMAVACTIPPFSRLPTDTRMQPASLRILRLVMGIRRRYLQSRLTMQQGSA